MSTLSTPTLLLSATLSVVGGLCETWVCAVRVAAPDDPRAAGGLRRERVGDGGEGGEVVGAYGVFEPSEYLHQAFVV